MKKYIVLVFACILALNSLGQNDTISSYVIATAGESVEVGGLNVSWTLGEIAIETLEDDNNTLVLTQGFQQGYFEITSISDPLSNNFKINIYPNPAREYIWIDLKSDEIKNAVIELYDLEGRVVYTEKMNMIEGQNKINLNSLNSNQYILRILDATGNVLQTFKLIKR